MDTLSKDWLIEIRDAILEVVDQSGDTIVDLVTTGKIEQSDHNYQKIMEYRNSLRDIADKLNSAFFIEVVTDIQEPGNRIVKATENVNAAITRLQDIGKFIAILTALTEIASTILEAVRRGNFLYLANLLPQIEGFA